MAHRDALVGISCCAEYRIDCWCQIVWEQYVLAVGKWAHATPILIPAIGTTSAHGYIDIERLLDSIDGVLLTGSVSNVEPHHYGSKPIDGALPFDPKRDSTTLPLIRRAVERGVPILAICRGAQELNVALGGNLHQAVHEIDGRLDHRARSDSVLERKYRPAHPIACAPDGLLAKLLRNHSVSSAGLVVNSLHRQAVQTLGADLQVEATASDGTIEAVSLVGAAFALGVQWHPEWFVDTTDVHRVIFSAFGDACREHAARKHRAERQNALDLEQAAR